MWHLIKCSWEHHKTHSPSLYGRFDLSYNGKDEPKLLEFNADTPTTLLETSVIQWYWLQDTFPEHDQYNCMHEKLIEHWKRIHQEQLKGTIENYLYFTSVKDSEEDLRTVLYLRDAAIQAGIPCAEHIYIDEIGFDEEAKCFVDLQDKPIKYLFKLYPWEWMANEDFGKRIGCFCEECDPRAAKIVMIEPPWKVCNKFFCFFCCC